MNGTSLFLCRTLVLIGFLGVIGLPLSSWSAEKPSVLSKEQQDLDFADGLYQRKMYDSAIKQYQRFLESYPSSRLRETALFRQGESYYQQATTLRSINPVQANVSLVKARAVFKDSFTRHPKGDKRFESMLRFGEIEYTLGEAKQGLDPLLQVINECKEEKIIEPALFFAARCHEALDKTQEAEKRYRQVVTDYPKGDYAPISTYLLAELLDQEKRHDEAIKLLTDLWSNPDTYSVKDGNKIVGEAKLRTAQMLYQQDRFDEASKTYQAYITEHPGAGESAKARYGAAWAEYRQRNYKAALEIANSLQRQALDSELVAGILFLQGTCSYQQKQYDEAILFFREVIADPKSGDYQQRAWYQLAWSYYLAGQYEKAIAECTNLLGKTLPLAMSSNVHFLRGQTYSQLNEYRQAVAELQIVSGISSEGEYAQEALYLLSDLLYRLEDYSASGQSFEKFITSYPQSDRAKDALVWAVNAYFAGKVFDKAVATADRLLKDYPDIDTQADILYRKALALYQMQKYDDAFSAFSAILDNADADNKKAEALYWQAYIHELQNKLQDAATTYGRLLKEFPSFKNRDEVRLRKALCDYQTQNHGVAYEGFMATLYTERGNKLPAEVIFWMIFTADERGKHPEALRIAGRVHELYEDESIRERASIAIGNQLVALKKWDDAITNGNAFVKAYPKTLFKPEIYWTLGRAYDGQHHLEKAIKWYEKSLLELQEMGSPDPMFEAKLYMDRGRLFERLKRTGEALNCYLRVSIIYDHEELTPEAIYRSVSAHLTLNERTEAQTMYRELLKHYPKSSWAYKAKQEFADQVGQPNSEPSKTEKQ